MDIDSGTVLLWLLGQVVAAVAIWSGIRSDVRHIISRLAEHQIAIESAHKRIDAMLERRANERT